ncbi:hypothetical protein BC835DRAFT_1418646 [Cytidiella melzeri]|nr:hypothetical protein BC835DRAFT_1418646 [Cytidiella melzeri]
MAHVRDLWEAVGNVQDLIKLRSKTPEDLIAITAKIVTEYASTNVLMKLGALPREEQDNLLKNTVIYCCDGLDYWDLDNAMISGDLKQGPLLTDSELLVTRESLQDVSRIMQELVLQLAS